MQLTYHPSPPTSSKVTPNNSPPRTRQQGRKTQTTNNGLDNQPYYSGSNPPNPVSSPPFFPVNHPFTFASPIPQPPGTYFEPSSSPRSMPTHTASAYSHPSASAPRSPPPLLHGPDMQSIQYSQQLYQQQLLLRQQQFEAQQAYLQQQLHFQQQFQKATQQFPIYQQQILTRPTGVHPSSAFWNHQPNSQRHHNFNSQQRSSVGSSPQSRAIQSSQQRSVTQPAPTSLKSPRPKSSPSVVPKSFSSSKFTSRLREATQFATTTATTTSSPASSTNPNRPINSDFSNADTVFTLNQKHPTHLELPSSEDEDEASPRDSDDPFPQRSSYHHSDEDNFSDSDLDDDRDARQTDPSTAIPSTASPPADLNQHDINPDSDSWIDDLTASFQRPLNLQQPFIQQQRAASPPAVNMSHRPTVSSRPSSRSSSGVRFVPHATVARRGSDQGGVRPSPSPPPTSSSILPSNHLASSPQHRHQRPRTTHGARQTPTPTAANAASSASRPSSRNGLTPRARPKSSDLLQRRHPSALNPAREAAAVFEGMFSPSSSSTTIQPLASPTTRRLRPPSSTLALGGSKFYSRLPNELWMEIMQYCDTTTLLTTVSRLDRTSRGMILDQEVWRHVAFPTLDQHQTSSGQQDIDAIKQVGRATSLIQTRLLSFASRWTLLQTLDLSGCSSFLRDEFFTKLDTTLMKYWALSLTELSLAKCTLLTDATLIVIAPACRLVTRLDLSWCQQFTELGFRHIIQSCGPSSLHSCVLNRCHGLTDDALGVLAEFAAQLRSLDLTFCTNMTDAGLQLLAANDSCCFYPASQDAVPNTTAIVLPPDNSYPGLQKLSLRWCRKITDDGIRYLMNGGVPLEDESNQSSAAATVGVDPDEDDLPPLLSSAPSIAMNEPPRRLNALESLNLDHCSLLTDRALMYLSKSALQLRDLSLVYCRLLTPVAFQYLVSGSISHLHRLVFDHCDHFISYLSPKNTPTLRILLASSVFQELRLLSFTSCPHVGMERTRHQEIEAECCQKSSSASSTSVTVSRPFSTTSSFLSSASTMGGSTRTGTSNVLDWVHKTTNKPSPTSIPINRPPISTWQSSGEGSSRTNPFVIGPPRWPALA